MKHIGFAFNPTSDAALELRDQALAIRIVYVKDRGCFVGICCQLSGDDTLKDIGWAGSKQEIFTVIRRQDGKQG